MSRTLLPPRGLFTGTRWLFDPALSASVKETLLQLMALTWGRDGHTSPPLSYPQLEALTGKNARTLRGHILALRTYHAALRLQRAETGMFIVVLADWLYRNNVAMPEAPCAQHGEFLPQLDSYDQEEEEEEIHPDLEMNLLLPDDQAKAAAKPAARLPKLPGVAAAIPAKKTLTRALETRLREAGVFPALLPEVESRAAQWQYSAVEIARLLDWCADEQPESPAALFIGRLRCGARAPGLYAAQPCERCGKRGSHAPDCANRYTQGF